MRAVVSEVGTSVSGLLFADHAVAVRVAHVLIGWVSAVDGSDAVGAGLGAGDSAVPVVVVQGQGVHVRSWSRRCRC